MLGSQHGLVFMDHALVVDGDTLSNYGYCQGGNLCVGPNCGSRQCRDDHSHGALVVHVVDLSPPTATESVTLALDVSRSDPVDTAGLFVATHSSTDTGVVASSSLAGIESAHLSQ